MARMGDRRCVYRILVGRPDGKRPLGRTWRRWVYNIKMDLQKVGWGHGLDCCGSVQRQVAGSCISGNEPSGSIKCEEILD